MDRQSLERLDKSELITLVLALTARVAALEAKLGLPPKTPDNSWLPPASAQKPNRSERRKLARKGRPSVTRALCPDPDHVREIYARGCAGCSTSVSKASQPEIRAYDHIDLPPVKPVTTRVHLHIGACQGCGARVAATPPADMPPGSPFGPAITAHVIFLHTRQMMSYARLVEVMRDLFGLTISQGAIANMIARAARPFAAAAATIAATVRAAAVVVHSDETSARVEGKTHWQWVFACATAAAHIIVPSRGKAVVTDFLAGARPAVWVADRLAAQGGHAERHQYCLAHLLRDAQYAIDCGDIVFAPAFKALLKRACAIGRRRDQLADASLQAHWRDLHRRLDAALALEPRAAEGCKLKSTMAAARQHLFVFTTRRDVPATNTVSERALRPSVIFRKVTNGFRSGWGAKPTPILARSSPPGFSMVTPPSTSSAMPSPRNVRSRQLKRYGVSSYFLEATSLKRRCCPPLPPAIVSKPRSGQLMCYQNRTSSKATDSSRKRRRKSAGCTPNCGLAH